MSSGELNVTIDKPKMIICFNDGTEEITEEQEVATEASTLNSAPSIDPGKLSWGEWFFNKASNAGSKMLNAVDYAGEGLADFFGITTPKYQLEIDEYERAQEETKRMEEESASWRPSSTEGQAHLVLNEPTSVGKIPEAV